MSDLRELQDVDCATYIENKLIRRTVERTLHLAVEACLDIGQHIIAQEGYRRPADNQDVFVGLAEQKILPDELLPRLIVMAGRLSERRPNRVHSCLELVLSDRLLGSGI